MPQRGVLSFWFEDSTPQQWFAKDDAFDTAIRQRFASLHHEVRPEQFASR
ncbi:DUF924 family protein [Acidovorax sp. SUPP3334]|nr:DUF924 family protein [Acidovorax sp. SUPP3334]GKT23203.1 hypothetical protein AVHM3334_10880 [Acidovorax sp. SUPP3334]